MGCLPIRDIAHQIKQITSPPTPCSWAVRLVIDLKYSRSRERVITNLKRVSKPGRRIYARKDRLPRVLGGMGVAILSTSNGLITSRTAQEKGVGGEVVCFIW